MYLSSQKNGLGGLVKSAERWRIQLKGPHARHARHHLRRRRLR